MKQLRLFMKIFKLSLLLVLLLSQPISASNIASRIDSLMCKQYRYDTPGASILIAHKGNVIFEKQYGIADTNTGELITPNTRFNIASVTKQFTVAAIMTMQDAGLLNIEDPVAKYFPEFKSDIWKKIKLKHLMSHSSGVPDLRPRSDRNFTLNINDEQSIEYMITLDSLKFEPGTQYDYVNPTFQLLYAIINRISGTDFETYQMKHLFQPSGMKNTLYFSPRRVIPNMAHGYIKETPIKSNDRDTKKEVVITDAKSYTDKCGDIWHEYDFGEETFFATKSDGGIYSTTRDFFKWENSLNKNICFSDKLKRDAYSTHIKVTGSKFCEYQNRDNTWYGYGWFIDKTPGFPTKIYHTGDNGGFQIYAAKYPDTDTIILIFENRNDIDRWSVAKQIDRILMEEGMLMLK